MECRWSCLRRWAAIAIGGLAMCCIVLPGVCCADEDRSKIADPLQNSSQLENPRDPASAATVSRLELVKSAQRAAERHGIPADFFLRLIRQESGFQKAVVSSAGAEGIAQFMPQTARERGLKDPFDPAQALPKSAELLKDLYAEFGNLGLAAAAYNAGSARVRAWLQGRSSLPLETQHYVVAITGQSAETWVTPGAHPVLRFEGHAPARKHEKGRVNWELAMIPAGVRDLLAYARGEKQMPRRASLARRATQSRRALNSSLRLAQSLCASCINQTAY